MFAIAKKTNADICMCAGTLSTLLDEGFGNMLKPATGFASNISTTLLANYRIDGCPPAGNSRRLLQQAHTVVVVVSNILVTLTSGTTYTIVDSNRKALIQFFENATLMRQLLGGNAVIVESMGPIPAGLVNGSSFNETYYFNISGVTSVPANLSDWFSKNGQPSAPPGVHVVIKDVPFVTDNTNNANNNQLNGQPKSSGGVREAALTMGVNTLLAMALIFVALQSA